MQIKQSTGEFSLPLIDIKEIERNFNKIKDKEKKRSISYVHISTIQILIKSTYLKGIDSPVSLALTDERILCPNDKLIGIIHGNLTNVTIKFDSFLGYAIPFREESLDRSIALAYKFHRQELMRDNDEPFSITYAVNYALTNSHHSIQFKRKDRIYLDDLFKKVSLCEIPRLKPITESKDLTLLRSKSSAGSSSRFTPLKQFSEIRRLSVDTPH